MGDCKNLCEVIDVCCFYCYSRFCNKIRADDTPVNAEDMREIEQLCERAKEDDDEEDEHIDEHDSKPWWPTVRIYVMYCYFFKVYSL